MKKTVMLAVGLGLLMLINSGCRLLKKRNWLPDHTEDYKTQVVTETQLLYPPGVPPIQTEDHYYVSPIPSHGYVGSVSLVPPLNPTLRLSRPSSYPIRYK